MADQDSKLKVASVRGQALQDQILTAGIQWLERDNPEVVNVLLARVKQATGPELREFTDAELRNVRNLAQIGINTLMLAWMEKDYDAEG